MASTDSSNFAVNNYVQYLSMLTAIIFLSMDMGKPEAGHPQKFPYSSHVTPFFDLFPMYNV